MGARNWVIVPLLIGLCSVGLLGCGQPKLGTEKNPVVMSLVPSGDTQEILASGDQLAKMVSDKTGLVVVANVSTDFAAVREAMGAGRAHIGWLNTFNYLLAHEKYGVDAALVTERLGLTAYQGQFNVRADSGIASLADLKGTVMCWVDPDSYSGYIIPRITLLANGVDPDSDFADSLLAGSHNNVLTAVYEGECDVGATYADARAAIEKDFPDVKETIAVLATTTAIPNDSLAIVKDFPEDERDAISTALLEIAASEDGKAILNTLYSITGLQRIDDSLFDAFRADLSRAGINIEDLAK